MLQSDKSYKNKTKRIIIFLLDKLPSPAKPLCALSFTNPWTPNTVNSTNQDRVVMVSRRNANGTLMKPDRKFNEAEEETLFNYKIIPSANDNRFSTQISIFLSRTNAPPRVLLSGFTQTGLECAGDSPVDPLTITLPLFFVRKSIRC